MLEFDENIPAGTRKYVAVGVDNELAEKELAEEKLPNTVGELETTLYVDEAGVT